MNPLQFAVDSRLPKLLSQEYSSTERALKELIDNSWDADAGFVSILLPAPMTDAPIVVEDNGVGMTEEELRRHYLSIASDRRARRGDQTSEKKRRVKGRKGIGKFAGLMAASCMQIETWSRGRFCSFTLRMEDLAQVEDIEELQLTLHTENCAPERRGTKITLTGLHQTLAFPSPDKLRQILLQEYGREEDFSISVDKKPLGVDDAPGVLTESKETLTMAGMVDLRFSISDQKTSLRSPGITIRVDGKAVGKPVFFGLDTCDDFPPKLLKKIYGEMNVDGLRDHLTGGWELIENSKIYQEIQNHAEPLLRAAYKEQYSRDIQLAQARLKRKVDARLATLPEYKRIYAEKAIKKIIERSYGEPESKVEPVVFVLLEALERSDYRVLLEHIAESHPSEISSLADSLNDFGLAEMAFLGEQARARSTFLDQLQTLCADENTLESSIHKALQSSLWVFGSEYSLFSSNQTLKRQVEDYLSGKYKGNLANKRPDLLLNENLSGEYLLIEFKRPTHALNFRDYQQATEYRNAFRKHTDKQIRVLLISGKRSSDFPNASAREPLVDAFVMSELISTARRQLEWLLKNLASES
jgi:hypothetical protein